MRKRQRKIISELLKERVKSYCVDDQRRGSIKSYDSDVDGTQYRYTEDMKICIELKKESRSMKT